MEASELPIAVIDSGVGGISVLNELLKILPNENYIYFGDSKNAPYGSRTKADVLDITRKNLAFLLQKGIKALVIACNTATSAAVSILREENPNLCIIGIEPAIKPAAELCDDPRVLVMATPLTLKEEKFLSLVARFSDKERILPLPCVGLVELIESGKLDGDELDSYLSTLFAPYKNDPPDAVVLGCTHYPHIKSAIIKNLPDGVVILDGGEGTARETKRRLTVDSLIRQSTEPPSLEIINTSDSPALLELSKRLIKRQ